MATRKQVEEAAAAVRNGTATAEQQRINARQSNVAGSEGSDARKAPKDAARSNDSSSWGNW